MLAELGRPKWISRHRSLTASLYEAGMKSKKVHCHSIYETIEIAYAIAVNAYRMKQNNFNLFARLKWISLIFEIWLGKRESYPRAI
jgi:hypothetical protein